MTFALVLVIPYRLYWEHWRDHFHYSVTPKKEGRRATPVAAHAAMQVPREPGRDEDPQALLRG